MMKEKYSKIDTVRQYRTKFPDYPNLKLARIIYRDHPATFRSVESVRGMLRDISGQFGRKPHGKVTHPSGPRPYNPYKLPESDETSYEPFILKAKRVALFSDIHIPYHSIEAITAAFDHAKKEKPDCIVLNGDTLDFHGLSRFAKNPEKRNFAAELKTFAEFFVILKRTFKGAQIVFKTGNHEERYQHYLWMKANELTGVTEFRLENIIKARAEGIQIVEDKRIIKAGDLNVIHGHEFATSFFSPVNPARGLYLRGKRSAIQGHLHQSSEHSEKDMNDRITTTWSLGCLCELHPAYMPINKWNHGFAIVDLDRSNFEVRNKRIYKGKVL